MKKLAIILFTIILVVILSPCLSVIAQPSHTPHEDPATAEDHHDVTSLLLFYDNMLDMVTAEQYQDARSMLNEVDYANIPEEIQDIISHYNIAPRVLFATLDNLGSLLDEASILMSNNQLSEAREKLDAAEALARHAQPLMDDIEASTSALSDILEVLDPSATSQITEAYDQLEETLHRLRESADEHDKLQESLSQKHETQAQKELIATELSLNVSPTPVFIGDSITVSGRLISDNYPLSKRRLTLLLDNKPVATTTNPDGSYTADITVPYRYATTVTLSAVYTPEGDDIGICLDSQSPPVVVTTSFYSTLLEVSAPETAHPGLPIQVSGRVNSAKRNTERIVKVFLDDTQLARKRTTGQFDIEITPPSEISTGKHSLRTVVEPQMCHAGISKSLTIDISTIPIQTDIQAPSLIVIPRPVQVSGKVYHSLGPLDNASVSLTFRESSTTVKTSADGSFTCSIETPINLSLVGPQEVTIAIEPVEPCYDSLLVKRWVFAINPSNIGLLLAAFIPLGLVVYQRSKARPGRPQEARGEVKPEEMPATTPPPRPNEFTGIKGRIFSAYLDGLEAVERTTGVPMAPHTTLRESLNAATPLLPTAVEPFSELTTLTEVALYSAHKLDNNTASKAEQLAAIIKKEIGSGTA